MFHVTMSLLFVLHFCSRKKKLAEIWHFILYKKKHYPTFAFFFNILLPSIGTKKKKKSKLEGEFTWFMLSKVQFTFSKSIGVSRLYFKTPKGETGQWKADISGLVWVPVNSLILPKRKNNKISSTSPFTNIALFFFSFLSFFLKKSVINLGCLACFFYGFLWIDSTKKKKL